MLLTRAGPGRSTCKHLQQLQTALKPDSSLSSPTLAKPVVAPAAHHSCQIFGGELSISCQACWSYCQAHSAIVLVTLLSPPPTSVFLNPPPPTSFLESTPSHKFSSHPPPPTVSQGSPAWAWPPGSIFVKIWITESGERRVDTLCFQGHGACLVLACHSGWEKEDLSSDWQGDFAGQNIILGDFAGQNIILGDSAAQNIILGDFAGQNII